MAVLKVSEQNFETEVLGSDVPVLLEFGAEWCGPCKMVAPELEALAAELNGKAKVATVDIDRSQLLAQQFGVQSVPTFVVLQQGRPVAAKVGALRRAQLRELIEPVLPRAAESLTPPQVAALLREGRVTPVDVRDAFAYRRAHLPQAIHIPIEDVPKRARELFRRGKVPVLYCRSGEKTKELAAELTAKGMAAAFVEGGILGWESSGLEVEKSD